ncbi:serine protease [Streptomyces sp. SID3343]|uniref:S1 family peptidase n=1 Tax=Streptomyces sp. SID3343 TaxID=2690260 RepID=UPI00136AF4DF|nr:serine protease [Streptomyces sp. SID3343]MYW00800.1 hypothetical protein [Streptomyces sp. SID3343]MYW04769.1 hypothetical protein [Streptomyces sp. SID3343]
MTGPNARVVEIHHGAGAYGTGCAIAPGLILTAAHVAKPDQDGDIEVRDLAGVASTASILWSDPQLDAALLRTDPKIGAETSVVRWGHLVCDDRDRRAPCTMAGMPQAMGRFTEGPSGLAHDVKTVDGHIKTGTATRQRMYAFEIDDAIPEATIADDPFRESPQPWSGMSGAGVFCGGALIGVTLLVPASWGEGILSVLPVEQLLARSDFVGTVAHHTGVAPFLQPADLAHLLKEPLPPALSSSFLLHPRSRVVPLSGMRRVLDILSPWCENTTHPTAVALITGRGGTGKNRLVPELLDTLAPWHAGSVGRRHWSGGFITENPLSLDTGALRTVDHPLVIAVDHAESRLQQIREVLDALTERDTRVPMRVLLIARDGSDTCWAELRRHCRDGRGVPFTSVPIKITDALETGNEHAYVDAKIAFARRIQELRQAGHGDDTWKNAPIADAPRTHGTNVEHSAPTPVVHLHIAALADVLTHANPQYAAEHNPLNVLLAHEEDYWRRLVTAHMSAERYDHALMRTMVATQYLAGATTLARGRAAVGVAYAAHHHGYPRTAPPTAEVLAPYDKSLAKAYPSGDGTHWGTLGPDLLAARLVDEVEQASDHTFITHVLLDEALDENQHRHAILNLVRASAVHPALADATRRAATRKPRALLRPTLEIVCTTLDRPGARRWLRALRATLHESSHTFSATHGSHQQALREIQSCLEGLKSTSFDPREFLSSKAGPDIPKTHKTTTTTKPADTARPGTRPPPTGGTTAPRQPAEPTFPATPGVNATPAEPPSVMHTEAKHDTNTIHPGSTFVRAVTSLLATTYTIILGWAVTGAIRATEDDALAWTLGPTALALNILFALLHGHFSALPRALGWSLPPTVLAVDIACGLGPPALRDNVAPALTWIAIVGVGLLSLTYAVRAWTGQIPWSTNGPRTRGDGPASAAE